MNTRPHIAFFGTPDVAVWVLEAMKENGVVPELIVTAPDAPKGRKLVMTPPPAKVWANENDIPVFQPENIKGPQFEEELKNFLKGETWDLFVVAAYGKIIPENILYLPTRKTINVHPSLLPELRGPSPLQTAILKDKRDTGVTIMRLDKEMDHGPVIAQQRLETASWPLDVLTLGKHLSSMGGRLIARILPDLLSGTIKETEQNHAKATFTKKVSKDDGLIDPNDKGYANWLKWNAYKGWPGCFFFAERSGRKVRVVISDAAYENGAFIIRKVIAEGKKESSYEEFLRSVSK